MLPVSFCAIGFGVFVECVRPLLDTEVVLYQLIALFYFFSNCMNGEWNIVFLGSCLFATVTVFDPRALCVCE